MSIKEMEIQSTALFSDAAYLDIDSSMDYVMKKVADPYKTTYRVLVKKLVADGKLIKDG